MVDKNASLTHLLKVKSRKLRDQFLFLLFRKADLFFPFNHLDLLTDNFIKSLAPRNAISLQKTTLK